jgi:replication-associated recombination protein RarA
MKLFTKNGRDFFEVASLLQKSLRRGDITLAAAAVNELFPKYANYCWNRLMTVSAEDCADFVTGEIVALYDGWSKVNQGKAEVKGRIFFAKAIIILCRARKSRDSDELNLLVIDRLPDAQFDAAVAACDVTISEADLSWDGRIPEYVYDVHTRKGKKAGKTKRQFIREERDDLVNAAPSIFANLDEMIDTDGWVEPEYRE